MHPLEKCDKTELYLLNYIKEYLVSAIAKLTNRILFTSRDFNWFNFNTINDTQIPLSIYDFMAFE